MIKHTISSFEKRNDDFQTLSRGHIPHKCVQQTRKWDFYWRQGWIWMIMTSPHQQYKSIDSFLVIQIRNQGIKLVNYFRLSGAPPPPARGLTFLCSWDIWWDIYWMHRYQEANWVIHRSYQIMFLHFFFAKEILFRGQTSCTFFPYVPGTSIFIDRPQNVG